MNKLYVFMIISLLFFSCKKEVNPIEKKASVTFTDNDFKTIINLKAKELTKLSDSIFLAFRMIINNDYLFVSEEKTNNLLHIINIPSDNYIGKYADKGNGPGEILVPWSFSTSENKELLVLDSKQKKIVKFNIDSLLSKKRFIEEFKLKEDSRCHDAIIYNNKIYVTDQNNLEYRFLESNLDGSDIKGFGTLPENKDFDESSKGKVSRAFMVNKKSTFAFGYLDYPLIELFDLEKNKWVSIVGPNSDEMPTEDFSRKGLLYGTLRITDNYIYALYSGKKGKPDVNIIYVFDYSGDPVKKIALDKGVFTFDVYKDKYIYGLNFEETKLLKYEIN